MTIVIVLKKDHLFFHLVRCRGRHVAVLSRHCQSHDLVAKEPTVAAMSVGRLEASAEGLFEAFTPPNLYLSIHLLVQVL